MVNSKIKPLFGIVLIIILFLVFSYFVNKNLEFVKTYLDFGFLGMIVYIGIVISSIVLAPVTIMPLIPLASALWGWIMAAVLTIIGWTIGATIAFFLARKYGAPLVRKIVSLEKLDELEHRIPEKNIFFTIVLLRMTVPFDGLSYLFGLFTKIKFKTYILATLIGFIPFTFVVAYLGTIELKFQLIAFAIALIILAFGVLIAKKKSK
ncbi:MAG: VTT domain-containing protein [Nanoarchaeota archaeon]|nr:VTT domain-containing protein [Nanoarchaeota archaeon]